VEVIEYCEGIICKDTGLVDGELIRAGLTCNTATPDELSDAKDAARKHVLACAFLFGSDKNCYRKLLEDLENTYTQGNDTYLTSLQQAYTLLVHWKQDPWNVVCLMSGVTDSVAFANVNPDSGQRRQIRCFHCGGGRAYLSRLPREDQ
jgi:hypothetical protein